MSDDQIIRKYEKTGTWIGVAVLGVVFLIISCLAPIDGVPGRKSITQEDFSIILALLSPFWQARAWGPRAERGPAPNRASKK
ncbi:MAG TPA: hypothetical protein VII92_14350 [Anaerolineae bacterium]